MKKPIFLPLLLLLSCAAKLSAQQNIRARVLTEQGEPLLYATVTLLNPSDSTMQYFGISNSEGIAEIKNVKPGNYLLQSAFIGFRPYYRALQMPVADPELPAIVMMIDTRTLGEVEVAAERIPLMIKGDTVEYNAGAFKTKPDANVEELFKKLPGVEVDRSGNIKAQGENVQKVLVDGKEFFSNDPKIATKNLPADAIKKVQVYDKKSDQAEFTGIDDGIRDKTINLQLKDDKKNGYFGDVTAGAGSDDHYRVSGKLYRFKPKSQFAALAMANNVNEFGFSVQDYISFRGGMRGLMDGSGQVMLGGGGSLPVNFGQQETGLITSGAGGLNYSYEPVKNNRFNISYLGNAAQKKLTESTYSRNFTPTADFIRSQYSTQVTRDEGHRANLSWRNDMDSSQQITLAGSADLTRSATNRRMNSLSSMEDIILNTLGSHTIDNANGLNASGRISYLKRLRGNWPLFRIGADLTSTTSLSNTTWQNISTRGTVTDFFDQYLDNHQDKLRYSGNTSLTRRLGGGYLLDMDLNAGTDGDRIDRKQGIPPGEITIDSLTATFTKAYSWIRPGLVIRRSTDKIKFNAALRYESGKLSTGLEGSNNTTATVGSFLPRFTWENDYNTGKRVALRYETRIVAPGITQMQPVVNNINPLQLSRGSRNLKTEYQHNLNANWLWYDQFSFTSLFVNLTGTYTRDKVNLARTIHPDLSQDITFVNVRDDYRAEGNVEFSTPVRKLGIGVNIRLGENYNKGINLVNGSPNINSTVSHEASLSIDNRKKEKVDMRIGASVRYSEARYSIQSGLNNNYYTLSWFADGTWTPSDKWSLSANMDVNQYRSGSFRQTIVVPLLRAQLSRYFLKASRGVISLEAFDLLNRNTGVQRSSELNYLQETRSNIIGRYFLISFKYKLNKLSGDGAGNVDIKIRNR